MLPHSLSFVSHSTFELRDERSVPGKVRTNVKNIDCNPACQLRGSAQRHPLPMQKRAICQSAFLNPRTLIVLLLSSIKTGAIHIALLCAAALSVHAGAIALVKPAVPSDGTWTVTGSLNTGRFDVHGDSAGQWHGACCRWI